MPDLPSSVRALVADSSGPETRLEIRPLPVADLGEGDVSIAVAWSSVNYKDGLASRKDGKVARIDPIVPGIDLAGTIVDPGGSDLAAGQSVLVHGYDTGVAHNGGYAEYARVPADWVVPLPVGLSARQAMTLGTAGFTAALSVIALEEHGLDE
jgi:acrylyl-CoA reductase (NADPH)